jgi:hypothetical protein
MLWTLVNVKGVGDSPGRAFSLDTVLCRTWIFWGTGKMAEPRVGVLRTRLTPYSFQ